MTATKVLRFELRDLARSRWVGGYALFLLLLTTLLLRFGGGGPRAVLSLMNVVLTVVPLASLVFGTMYLYGSRDFIELLLAQPVSRPALFAGLYAGLVVPLACGFLLGVGLPFLWYGTTLAGPVAALLGTGTLLTLVFTAVAMLVSLTVDDRAKGLGAAILLWLGATALYDALLVLVASTLSDHPLELPLLGPHPAQPRRPWPRAVAAPAGYGGADGLHGRRLRAILRERTGGRRHGGRARILVRGPSGPGPAAVRAKGFLTPTALPRRYGVCYS